MFIAELPLSAGTYTTGLGSGLGTLNTDCPGGVDENCSVGFDYTLSYEISEVPIPATFWLFGSGLLGLVGNAHLSSPEHAGYLSWEWPGYGRQKTFIAPEYQVLRSQR